jgi:4-hydroxybenzoate polyprenyltransferase
VTAARSIQFFAKDIKLSHSIFALPFALSALTFLSVNSVTAGRILLIVVCMVTARSFAMGMNRYLDRHIDAGNPRTRGRMIPAAQLTAGQSLGWSLTFGALFVVCSFALSRLAGLLSLPLLVVLAGYSWQKRYTWLCHLYLGMCLGFSPIAVEIALTGQVSLPVLLVGLGVAFWTAGFDVIYSLQDRGFDLSTGLHSIPQRFGFAGAINLSRLLFGAMVLSLAAAGWVAGSGWIYFAGIALIAVVLAGEHYLIRDAKKDGSSRYINKAFFDFNAFVSLFFFTVALTDVLLRT